MPPGMMKATWAPTAAYNIEEGMWGLEEEGPKVKARNCDVGNHKLEQRNTCSQCAGQGNRWHG